MAVVFPEPYLGPNVPQEPLWDSRDWADVEGWELDGEHAQANGTDICDAFQYGRDPEDETDERPGPWQRYHAVRIKFRHNMVGDPISSPIRRFSWTWVRSSIDGTEAGAFAVLDFGDMESDVPGQPQLYYGGPPVDVAVLADTDYILELDCVTFVRARLYEPGEEATAEWFPPAALYTGHGATRSSLRMTHQGAVGDILEIDQIDVAVGPSTGQAFGPMPIALGDEVTDTFVGWPTQDSTVIWYVDGIATTPASVNEVTGEVTFDRPPAKDAVIYQQGRFRAE